MYQAVLDRFVTNAHRVVTTSEAMIDVVPLLKRHQDRCTVSPPAADVQQREVRDDEKQRLLQDLEAEGRPVILFVGRLVYYKGIDVLLRAMTLVDDAMLLVVGKGPEREALEELAAVLGIADRVRFEGFVSDEALPAYYSIADVFALPSISSSEAFGIVQVEAMMYGVPVVNTSFDTGSVSGSSRHSEAGILIRVNGGIAAFPNCPR